MNFREASRKLADLSNTELDMTTDFPIDRPVSHQPPVETDGLDPAAPGGPAPMNAGVGPAGQKVVTDPMTPVPQDDKGGTMPHIKGPDVDTTVLRNYRDTGR